MNFDVFDKSEIEKYEEEVRAKWGHTKAYQEYRQKDAARNEDDYPGLAGRLMTMFSELGALKHLTPDADEVQARITALQEFITEHYYVCTDEILRGLGELYACDERFRRNIDKAGGDGTADFVRQAVAVHTAEEKI